jgi:DtxR family Mn-dependent transcriptional regulator
MSLQTGESREDYLETILILMMKKGQVRSIDIAEYMDYSKPSISRAMSLLREAELITMDKHGWISFTTAGRKLAEQVYERHRLLTAFLSRLGVDKEIAEHDACRMEHVISPESFERIKAFMAASEEA